MNTFDEHKLALYGGKPVRDIFLPFSRPTFDREEEKEIIDTLHSGWVTKGPKTKLFEEKFKEFTGAKYAVAVSSCTAALHLSLMAIGIRPKDEIITTPFTFPSTANVIEYMGAKPVFVDIEEDTFNIAPKQIEKAITYNTKAIILVHFAGHPCEMDKILYLAKKYNLFVIEDAAHALGSKYCGRKVGNIGDLTCFSFYPTKLITTGEGGMVTTDRREFARKIEILSSCGISSTAWRRSTDKIYKPWDTLFLGYKYNMSDLQASLGLVQLKKIEEFLRIRKRYVQMYNKVFSKFPEIITPIIRKGILSAYHLYVIKLKIEDLTIKRNMLVDALRAENIGVGVHFKPLHLHSYYRKKYGFKKRDFPIAEDVFERVISLPLYSAMSEKDVKDVILAVKKVVSYYRKRKW